MTALEFSFPHPLTDRRAAIDMRGLVEASGGSLEYSLESPKVRHSSDSKNETSIQEGEVLRIRGGGEGTW